MTAQESLKVMVTGTPLFVMGKSFESGVIETLTGQEESHAATAFNLTQEFIDLLVKLNHTYIAGAEVDDWWVAEENERDGSVFNAGFQCVPFALWITQQTGPIYFGTAPQSVKDHPEKVMHIIQWYQAHPADQHYGFGSLLPIFLNHWLDKIDPACDIPIPSFAEVCSTFSTACEDSAGANMPTDQTPGDLAQKSLPLTLIETS